MSPWSNAAPTLRCGIRTVGTGVSPARYAHRCRGGRPRSRARPHIPSRIAPSGFHTCGPRTAAARTAYARQAHPRLRRDTAMPRRRIPRAGHFNIMLARIPPSSSSTIISPLRARRASVQRSSGIRPIPNGNRLHAPARKSAGPRRSRRSPRYPQMLPVVSCYFFLFEPR